MEELRLSGRAMRLGKAYNERNHAPFFGKKNGDGRSVVIFEGVEHDGSGLDQHGRKSRRTRCETDHGGAKLRKNGLKTFPQRVDNKKTTKIMEKNL